jgi:hypothetical protein
MKKEKYHWDDKEFIMWAFGRNQVDLSETTFEEMIYKLHEVYRHLEDGTIQQRYIMEKMGNSIFPKLNSNADKDIPHS